MKNKTIFKINIIYFVALVGVAILFALGYLGIIKNDILASCLIQIVVMFAIPLLLYTLMVSKNFKTTFKHAGFKKITLKAIFISLCLGIVLYFINTYVADIFQTLVTLFGFENIYGSSKVTLNYELLFKEFCLSTILPAICEEFLHRGILLHAGKKAGNIRYSLIVSSILFGLTHLNINQFFYATILGGLIGYVSLVSDSIYPAIIIHFMNNFLSNYFYYGVHLDFPLAKLVYNIRTVLFSNYILFVFVSTICLALMVYLYLLLVKKLTVEKVKVSMEEVVIDLGVQNTTVDQAQDVLNQINFILNSSKSAKSYIAYSKGEKYSFIDNIFLITSILLGATITIISFIWGVI